MKANVIKAPTDLEKKLCMMVVTTTYLAGTIGLYWKDLKYNLKDAGVYKQHIKMRYNKLDEEISAFTSSLDHVVALQGKNESSRSAADAQLWLVVEDLTQAIDSHVYIQGIDKTANIIDCIITLLQEKHKYICEKAGFLRTKEFDDNLFFEKIKRFTREVRSNNYDLTAIIESVLKKYTALNEFVGTSRFESNCETYKIIKEGMNSPWLRTEDRREFKKAFKDIEKRYFGLTLSDAKPMDAE